MRPDNFDPGPLADVTCHTDGTRSTLIFVRDFRQAPDKVWAALTDPAQLRKWSPFVPDRDLSAEGSATLEMLGVDPPEIFNEAVVRAERPSLLEYTWGGDRLIWELTPNGAGTRLTLRHTVESIDWVPKVTAGWHLCFIAMDAVMDGRPVDPVVGEDAKKYKWDWLRDAYAARLDIALPVENEGVTHG